MTGGGIYMVSAQKPTAVTHSILGRFTSVNDLNLAICKSNQVEIYKVTAEGLKFLKQVAIWGIVENMAIIRLKNDKKDSLLLTTCKHDVMVISCDMSSRVVSAAAAATDGAPVCEVVTRTFGNFKDAIPRNSSTHMICIVDSSRPAPLVAIKCYDGILKLIPINSDSKQLSISSIRMDDLNVVDMHFLHGYDNTTCGLVCKEPNNKLIFKIYEIDVSKDVMNLVRSKEINDNQAFIIPVPEPFNGVIIVGTQTIVYISKNGECINKSPSFLNQCEVTTHAQIDANGQRYLLSNAMGQLFLMVLFNDETTNSYTVTDIRFESLGETAISDNMTYIDNGVVFVGSKLGDSQLIKLRENADADGSYIDVLETYTNLGPILDMLVVDIEKQGQGQLITCSGGHRSGCLRIIRSGIGIHESASVELPGVKAFWPLKINSNEFDDHLVLSFYGYTKIFSFVGEEIEDVELTGFDLESQTLHSCNVIGDQLLQITSNAVRLIRSTKADEETMSSVAECRLVAEWTIPAGELISVATSSHSECLLACRNQLYLLQIGDASLTLINKKELEHEIACLDMYAAEEDGRCELCAVGLWSDISARLLTLPALNEIVVEKLAGDVIPRSILIESIEQILYLFVSLGDGSVITYIIVEDGLNINTNSKSYLLTERRKVVLGTQPTILKKFRFNRRAQTTTTSNNNSPPTPSNIFACSDRPSVISSANQKLVYSSVNLKQVDYICQLDAKHYPNSLALISGGGLVRIGQMDRIQKLHIRSVPLHETVRRICHQADTHTFGLVTFRMDVRTPGGDTRPMAPSASTQCAQHFLCKSPKDGGLSPIPLAKTPHTQVTPPPASASTSTDAAAGGGGGDVMASLNGHQTVVNSFLILEQNTFEVLQSVQLLPGEFGVSVLSMSFSAAAASGQDVESPSCYFVLGCCVVNDEEPEPRQGCIVVFKYSAPDNKLTQVCERDVKGAPYCMQNYHGKLLVGVSNKLHLYELAADGQLNALATYSDNVFILYLKCKNDFILVGDMMKSCAVLTYRAETSAFELVAKDHQPIWLSSIEIVDDDTFLMSDCFQNVLALRKDSGQPNEDERKSLQSVGCIHLGEQINVFRHGSLGMQQQQQASSDSLLATHFYGTILAGTVGGSVILFAQLSDVMFKILNELQARIAAHLTTAGRIQFDKWRDFESERRVEEHKHFIDGDLIESFLELTATEAKHLIKDFRVDNSTKGHNNEEFSLSYFNKLVEELSRSH